MTRGAQATTPFLTRLHVRYDRAHFPQDLVLQETADRVNFSGAIRAPTRVDRRRRLRERS